MTQVTEPGLQPQRLARTGPAPKRTQAIAVSFELRMDAERWRAQFVGAVRGVHDAEALNRDLVSGIEQRKWTHLQDEQGRLFRDFDGFCSTPIPFGLGQDPAVVRTFLTALLGVRQTDLLLVPPSRRGITDDEPASRQLGGKSKRENERLRAIQERAPAEVWRLRALGILSTDEAARFGKREPTETQRAMTEEFVQSVRSTLDDLGERPSVEAIAAAEELVRRLLPRPARDSAEKVIKRLQKLSPEEQDKVMDWLLENRGTPMGHGIANGVVSISVDPSPQEKSPKERLLSALIKDLRVSKARAGSFVSSLGDRIDTEPLGTLLAEASRQLC